MGGICARPHLDEVALPVLPRTIAPNGAAGGGGLSRGSTFQLRSVKQHSRAPSATNSISNKLPSLFVHRKSISQLKDSTTHQQPLQLLRTKTPHLEEMMEEELDMQPTPPTKLRSSFMYPQSNPTCSLTTPCSVLDDLRLSSFNSCLPPSVLTDFAKFFQVLHYASGEVIFSPGEEANMLFVVRSGLVGIRAERKWIVSPTVQTATTTNGGSGGNSAETSGTPTPIVPSPRSPHGHHRAASSSTISPTAGSMHRTFFPGTHLEPSNSSPSWTSISPRNQPKSLFSSTTQESPTLTATTAVASVSSMEPVIEQLPRPATEKHPTFIIQDSIGRSSTASDSRPSISLGQPITHNFDQGIETTNPSRGSITNLGTRRKSVDVGVVVRSPNRGPRIAHQLMNEIPTFQMEPAALATGGATSDSIPLLEKPIFSSQRSIAANTLPLMTKSAHETFGQECFKSHQHLRVTWAVAETPVVLLGISIADFKNFLAQYPETIPPSLTTTTDGTTPISPTQLTSNEIHTRIIDSLGHTIDSVLAQHLDLSRAKLALLSSLFSFVHLDAHEILMKEGQVGSFINAGAGGNNSIPASPRNNGASTTGTIQQHQNNLYFLMSGQLSCTIKGDSFTSKFSKIFDSNGPIVRPGAHYPTATPTVAPTTPTTPLVSPLSPISLDHHSTPTQTTNGGGGISPNHLSIGAAVHPPPAPSGSTLTLPSPGSQNNLLLPASPLASRSVSPAPFASLNGLSPHPPRVACHPGWLGDVGLILDVPRTATIQALSDCVLLELQQDRFRNFLQLVPEVLQAFQKRLSSSYHIHILHLLSHPLITKSFVDFCRKEYSAENYLCWNSCITYRVNYHKYLLHASRNKENAKDILDQFIRSNSETPVNLKGSTIQRILSRFDAGLIDADLFIQAEEEVLSLMNSDSFQRYKQSEAFQKVLTEINTQHLENIGSSYSPALSARNAGHHRTATGVRMIDRSSLRRSSTHKPVNSLLSATSATSTTFNFRPQPPSSPQQQDGFLSGTATLHAQTSMNTPSHTPPRTPYVLVHRRARSSVDVDSPKRRQLSVSSTAATGVNGELSPSPRNNMTKKQSPTFTPVSAAISGASYASSAGSAVSLSNLPSMTPAASLSQEEYSTMFTSIQRPLPQPHQSLPHVLINTHGSHSSSGNSGLASPSTINTSNIDVVHAFTRAPSINEVDDDDSTSELATFDETIRQLTQSTPAQVILPPRSPSSKGPARSFQLIYSRTPPIRTVSPATAESFSNHNAPTSVPTLTTVGNSNSTGFAAPIPSRTPVVPFFDQIVELDSEQQSSPSPSPSHQPQQSDASNQPSSNDSLLRQPSSPFQQQEPFENTPVIPIDAISEPHSPVPTKFNLQPSPPLPSLTIPVNPHASIKVGHGELIEYLNSPNQVEDQMSPNPDLSIPPVPISLSLQRSYSDPL